MSSPRIGPRIWIDVDDLFHYLDRHDRPSGIQRVTFEICQALHDRDDGAGMLGFLRRRFSARDLVIIEWSDVVRAYTRAANAGSELDLKPILPRPFDLTDEERPEDRAGLLRAGIDSQWQALQAFARIPVRTGRVAAAALRSRRGPVAGSLPPAPIVETRLLQDVSSPGDVLLALGSPWVHPDYARTVRFARDERRMRFALLVHDLLPIRHPEWTDFGVLNNFHHWHTAILRITDQVFANSRNTAADVERFAADNHLQLPRAVHPIPMGTAFGTTPHRASHPGPHPGPALAPNAHPHIPPPGTYALFVSTLEARKNHALLFRIWRRLIADLLPDQVPTLVFVGRVGWLVADFLQQLENASWLGGKILHLPTATDAELLALYRGCRFTLFPSFFEGWGLPISESLALGRPCLAADSPTLSEAGGTLARYFDPDSLTDSYRAVRALIDDPADLEAWSARIAQDFRPVPWDRAAETIIASLQTLDEA